MDKQIIAAQTSRDSNKGRCLGKVRLELERMWEDERRRKWSFDSTAK